MTYSVFVLTKITHFEGEWVPGTRKSIVGVFSTADAAMWEVERDELLVLKWESSELLGVWSSPTLISDPIAAVYRITNGLPHNYQIERFVLEQAQLNLKLARRWMMEETGQAEPVT